jgi:hypothetical protein
MAIRLLLPHPKPRERWEEVVAVYVVIALCRFLSIPERFIPPNGIM